MRVSLCLALALSFAACGGDQSRPRTPLWPQERPSTPPLPERYPECIGSLQVAPLVTLGCQPHCLPPTQPRIVCTDTHRLAMLPRGSELPTYIATRDPSHPNCPDGWRIELLSDPQVYTDFHFSWAKHPPPTDQRCDQALPLDWGFFGRQRDVVYLTAQEYTPNE